MRNHNRSTNEFIYQRTNQFNIPVPVRSYGRPTTYRVSNWLHPANSSCLIECYSGHHFPLVSYTSTIHIHPDILLDNTNNIDTHLAPSAQLINFPSHATIGSVQKKKKWKIVASNCEYWHANFSIFLLNDWVALFNVHLEPTISAAVLHMLYHQSDISHSFVTQRAPYVRLLYAICIWKYFAIANFYVIFNSSEVTVRNTAVACKWTYDAVDASTVRIFIYGFINVFKRSIAFLLNGANNNRPL